MTESHWKTFGNIGYVWKSFQLLSYFRQSQESSWLWSKKLSSKRSESLIKYREINFWNLAKLQLEYLGHTAELLIGIKELEKLNCLNSSRHDWIFLFVLSPSLHTWVFCSLYCYSVLSSQQIKWAQHLHFWNINFPHLQTLYLQNNCFIIMLYLPIIPQFMHYFPM